MASVDLVPYLLYLGLPLLLYTLLVYGLHLKGWLGRDKALSLFGPALMIKTLRGRKLLDRLGHYRRFWNAFGDLGIALGFAGMIGMFALLIWGAWRATTLPASARPSLAQAVTIPGLNPLLPLGYGLLALVVAVVLHEFCHGILARANEIKVKSLGVLLLVIPLGAFVEQDEEDMTKAPARKRDRVAAAGVMANFALAVLFFLIMAALLTSSVHAKADGIGVLEVFSGSPAANTSTALGSDGLAVGDLLTSFNGTATPNVEALEAVVPNTHPGESVPVSWYSQSAGGIVTTSITLSAAIHFLPFDASDASELANLSFMGIGETPIPPAAVLSILSAGPAASGTGVLLGTNSVLASSVIFLALPATTELPIQNTMAEFYTVSGPLGALGASNFWIVVNSLYWLVWVNFLLGVFNALPAVPLDGGFLFRDVVGGFFARVRPAWPKARREGAVNTLSLVATLTVFLLILWELIGPGLL